MSTTKPRPATLNPREWARWYLRGYESMDVPPYYRDIVDYINSGRGGFFGQTQDGKSVRISCASDLPYGHVDDDTWLRVRAGEVGVALDERITGVFKVSEILNELRSGISQPSLFSGEAGAA